MASQITSLRFKSCACCTVRLDSTPKRGITTLRDKNIIASLNTYKSKILTDRNKPPNDTIIKQGDLICGSCKSAAKRYSLSPFQSTARSVEPTMSERYLYILYKLRLSI